jgi:methylated-DNA-[protein]-cysteine S-methyltransferase
MPLLVSEMDLHKEYTVATFPSSLGWMAIAGSGGVLRELTFGHVSESAASSALWLGPRGALSPRRWKTDLVRRLQAYADGQPDDFLDVEIDLGPLTAFRTRVVAACRAIAWGEVLTYAQLAALTGSPGAARAVGNCMARNRIPLVIPCHRVVASDRSLGGYSAPGGLAVKRRLLALEQAVLVG